MLAVSAERIAPTRAESIIIALKSQEIGVLFTLIISPKIQNTVEKSKKTKQPQIRPQSRASEHLFFFTEAKPPKNDDAYIAKKENGVIRE